MTFSYRHYLVVFHWSLSDCMSLLDFCQCVASCIHKVVFLPFLLPSYCYFAQIYIACAISGCWN